MLIVEQIKNKSLPIGELDIILQDDSSHTLNVKHKKNFIKFIDYMKDSAKQMPFTASELLYHISKPGEKPSDIWVWGCCGLQVLSIVFGIILGMEAQEKGYTDIQQMSNMRNLMYVIYMSNCGLCYMDGIGLRKRGIEDVNTKMSFIIPVYLFQRAKKLEGTNVYAIAWCIVFTISMFF